MLNIKNFKKAEKFRFLSVNNLDDSEATEMSMLLHCPVAYFS